MKTFKLFCMALMAVLMSAGFAACGDDDEEDTVSSEIVGTWVADSYTTITFNSNGTGYVTETYNGETETYNFTFTYNAETGILKVTEDGETVTMTNVKIHGNTLTYVDEEGDTVTLTKKGSTTDDDDNSGSSEQETSGNLLTSVVYPSGALFKAAYDSKGNVTEFTYGGATIYYTYNSSNKLESMKFYDEDEWVYLKDIEFTSAGNIKSLKQTSDDGWYSNLTCTYDSNDRLTNVYIVDNDGEKCTFDLTWENGCLMKMDFEELVVVDDPDGPDEYHYTFTYGDKLNVNKCYTAFCSPLMAQFLITGFVGKGSDYLPTSVTEDGDTYGLSYTTDAYGKILIETVSNDGYEVNLIYNYGTSSSVKQHKLANAKQGNMKLPTMLNFFGKRK